MKILIIYSDINCSCTRKNTFEMQKGLSKFAKVDTLYYEELNEGTYKKYNVVIFQRLGGNGVSITSRYFKYFDKLAKKHKGKIFTVYNIDDLLIYDSVKKFLTMVDMVLVPHKKYVKHVKKYNQNIEFYQNFIDVEKVESIEEDLNLPKNKTKLLWGSTAMEGTGFMEELIPAIKKEFPDAVIYIMGLASHLFKKYDNVITMPVLKFEDYIKVFKNCDICLNPISIDQTYVRGIKTEDFLNCKSPIKYLNAGLCKKPIISSKSYPYIKALKNHSNGIILDNNIEDWIESIRKLKEDSKYRNKLVKIAYKDVTQNYTLEKMAEKVHQILLEQTKDIDFYDITEKEDIEDEIPKATTLYPDIMQDHHTTVVGEIFGGRTIVQTFKSSENFLSKVQLKAATYMRENQGVLNISLKDVREREIRSTEISFDEIKDNDWFDFDFEPIKDSKNKHYYLVVKGKEGAIGKSITLYYSGAVKEYGEMIFNKTKFTGNLTFRTYYKK